MVLWSSTAAPQLFITSCLLWCRLGRWSWWSYLYRCIHCFPWSQSYFLEFKEASSIASSSTEAEYRAIASTTAELQWLRSLLEELGVLVSAPPNLYSDNIGATYLCANPVFHCRMKHIALDYHFIRELVQSGRLRVSHVSSTDQLADALTKPLPHCRIQYISHKIGVSTRAPSWGSLTNQLYIPYI